MRMVICNQLLIYYYSVTCFERQSNDSLTQFSSNFKAWEIVFLRKAIEEIVER